MNGHVWFIHHFKQIGNPLIDSPDMIHNIALCGVEDSAEVCMIDPLVTFSVASFQAPNATALFQIQDANQLSANLDAASSEAVNFTGIMFLPPF